MKIISPLPVESLGGWHPRAITELKRIARAQARTKGGDDDSCAKHLFQHLSILLMKGNLALLSSREPLTSSFLLEEDLDT